MWGVTAANPATAAARHWSRCHHLGSAGGRGHSRLMVSVDPSVYLAYHLGWRLGGRLLF